MVFSVVYFSTLYFILGDGVNRIVRTRFGFYCILIFGINCCGFLVGLSFVILGSF